MRDKFGISYMLVSLGGSYKLIFNYLDIEDVGFEINCFFL